MSFINYKLKPVFEFEEYRAYLLDIFKTNESIYGLKSEISKAAGCSPAYISHVLNGKAELTRDQIFALSTSLNLSSVERDYLLLLLEKVKSKTESYKKHISEQLKRLKSEDSKKHLEKTTGRAEKIESEIAREYYSHWMYAAIHLYLLIEPKSTVSTLSKHFHISKETVDRVLKFLYESKIVSFKNEKWEVLKGDVNLPNDERMSFVNHMNWRMKAIDMLNQRQTSDSYHFSSAVAASKEDQVWLKERLRTLLTDFRTRLKKSESEELFAFNFDLFSL